MFSTPGFQTMMDIRVFQSHGATGIHNALFDSVMPQISGNAWKLLCLVLRQTVGWKRQKVGLSYTDLIKGMGVKSRATVAAALKELATFNLILTNHAERWEETQFSLNHDAVVRWIPVDFGSCPPVEPVTETVLVTQNGTGESVPKSEPVPETVTESPVTENEPVTESGTGKSVPETVPPIIENGTAPVPETVLFNRKEINIQHKDIIARARDGGDDGGGKPSPVSDSPEIGAHTSGERLPQTGPGASPSPALPVPPTARSPVTIYAQISNRQLSIAETELIEARVPQSECDQFERFLRGWAATYGTKAVFNVLEVYDKRKPKQSNFTRPWTDEEREAYHAEWRRVAKAGGADKPIARPRKPIQSAVAAGAPSGRDGYLADGAQMRTPHGVAPCLPLGALIEAKKRFQQAFDSGRPAVRVEEAPGEPDLQCPF
jgi:hypothetical protein